jgi:hypothetical protein
VTGREPDITAGKVAMMCSEVKVSSARARRELGYAEFSRSDIEAAVRESIEWLRLHGIISPARTSP